MIKKYLRRITRGGVLALIQNIVEMNSNFYYA